MIHFVVGDATIPPGPHPRMICHVCNDTGKWGLGFAAAISNRWLLPEEEYRSWHREVAPAKLPLGAVQFLGVEPGITVANMIGQHGVKSGHHGPPVRYPAIQDCLKAVAERASQSGASVHMPRIGCGVAGGDWAHIEILIRSTLSKAGIETTVYDLPSDIRSDAHGSDEIRTSQHHGLTVSRFLR